MPIKTYTEEFRRDAVALYENSPGVSINALATELGV
ncbi:transposase, partial [Corynebacterium sp.]